MNKLVLTLAFLLHLAVFVRTAPIGSNETLLGALVTSGQHPQYKCPYLRTTLLDKTKFGFLETCPDPLKPRTNSDMLCILFYNNFLRLCNYSNGFDPKVLFNDSTIKASINTTDINTVCNNLETSKAFDDSFNRTVTPIIKFLKTACAAICVNIADNTSYPVCTLSGLMNNVIKQISDIPLKTQLLTKEISGGKKEIKPPPLPVNQNQSNLSKKPQVAPQNVENQKHVEETRPEMVQNDKADKLLKAQKTDDNVKAKIPEVNEKSESIEIKEEKSQEVESTTKKPKETQKVQNETPQEVNAKDQKPADPVNAGPPEADAEVERPDENVNDRPDLPNGSQEYDLDEDVLPRSDDALEAEKKAVKTKPKETSEDDNIPANANNSGQMEEEDSFFFVYFMMVCAVFILGYIGYHNKQKVLALVIEGRRGRRTSRRGGRPNSANYHKLDSNLEEAVTSSVHKNTTNIIY